MVLVYFFSSSLNWPTLVADIFLINTLTSLIESIQLILKDSFLKMNYKGIVYK